MALPSKNPDEPRPGGETTADLRRRLSEVSAELAEAKHRIEQLSLTDELTELPNLRGFVLLAELDWVIGSVHTRFTNDQKVMTGRILEAIENPQVDCIGHLTGRMLGRRDPYPVDIEAVAEAAQRTGTMLEINGNPNRRDLSERHARLAAEAGALICVNTDAHRVATLDNMTYGIATARRAWLTADQISNTRAWREFARLRKRARRKPRDLPASAP